MYARAFSKGCRFAEAKVHYHGLCGRDKDLEKAFGGSGRRLVMVTAFRSRLDLVRTMDRISSDTSVWIVESPFRLISVQSGSGEHHAEGPSALDVGQRDAWARLETHKPNRNA